MKKHLFLFSLIISHSILVAMEQPELDSPRDVPRINNQLASLLKQYHMSHATPIKIESGFGQNFDYSSLIESDQRTSYIRRLKLLKHDLFDYIEGYSRNDSADEMASGIISIFLQEYVRLSLIQMGTVPFGYCFGHIPTSIITSPSLIKSIQLSKKIIQECGGSVPNPSIQVPDELDRYFPIVDKGDYLEYSPVEIKNSTEAIMIAPELEDNARELHIKQSVHYIVTQPDAESFLISWEILQQKQAAINEFESSLIGLQELGDKGLLSSEAQRLLVYFTCELSVTKLHMLTEQQRQKKRHEEPRKEDKPAYNTWLNECPHIIQLKIFYAQLLKDSRSINNNLLEHYVAAFDTLLAEYKTLYERISKELKTFKRKSTKIKPRESSKSTESKELKIEKPEPVKVKVLTNPTPAKITYSKRITQWFKDSFIKNQTESSILYHTMLPTIADAFVIKHGERSAYNNKTYMGQRDNCYSIAGKIISHDTKEKSYCRFTICLDPHGICYHRHYKKCTWQELPKEVVNDVSIEDTKYENSNEDMTEPIGAQPMVLRDSDTFVEISNPTYNCTILLYKRLL